MRRILVLVSALALLLAAAAPPVSAGAAGPKPEYFIDEDKLPFAALNGATAYWGVHSAWNGRRR